MRENSAPPPLGSREQAVRPESSSPPPQLPLFAIISDDPPSPSPTGLTTLYLIQQIPVFRRLRTRPNLRHVQHGDLVAQPGAGVSN